MPFDGGDLHIAERSTAADAPPDPSPHGAERLIRGRGRRSAGLSFGQGTRARWRGGIRRHRGRIRARGAANSESART